MENNQSSLKIRIDDVVYNLTTIPETDTTMVHLDGVKISQDPNSAEFITTINKHCCVFSHMLDLLAYISLLRRGDAICDEIPSADYLVIKPNSSYPITYDILKHYKQVYGFLRINTKNRVVNNILADLLGFKYCNYDYKYFGDEALVSYCIRTYRALEL